MTPPGASRPLRVVQLVTTLARGGAQATVLASADPEAIGAVGDPGRPVEVRVLAGLDVTGEGDLWDDPALATLEVVPVPPLVRSIRPSADLRALRWLVRWLRAERPDVIHTHSTKAGVLGRLAAAIVGIPCVHTVHGWGPIDASSGPTRRAVIALERILARRSAALVVVGRPDLDTGLALGIGRAERYHLIRSGVDLNAVGDPTDRAEVRGELDLDDRFVVGMVARLSPQKDQATLIDAFTRARRGGGLGPAPTLVIVGDGPNRVELERRAASAGGDIRFLGQRPDGARLVAGFDAAANATRWEGLPRFLVEAAAAGVPLVATDVGATAELVEHGLTGSLVPPRSAPALAEALTEIHADRGEAARRADRARGRAQEFSADRMRRELVRLWRSVAEPTLRPSEPTGPSARRTDLAPLPRSAPLERSGSRSRRRRARSAGSRRSSST